MTPTTPTTPTLELPSNQSPIFVFYQLHHQPPPPPPPPPPQQHTTICRKLHLMATTTPLLSPPPPPISPHEEVDNNHQQPPTACSPPQAPPSPIEYLNHHQQFTNSITPSPPPQPPENSTDSHRQQPLPPPPPSSSFLPPPSPPPTVAEPPPENYSPSGQSALQKQPLASPTTEIPGESPDFCINPNPKLDHEVPLSKQPPSSSPSPSPSPSPSYSESPNYRENPSPNPNFAHESPSPSSPVKPQGDPKPNQSPKEPSLSPPLTTGSPPSPRDAVVTPPPLGVPLLLHTAVGGSPSKPKGSPWTNQETANLIQAYQEKWYSLKKGPLKAGQWEEVAITVAARCGYDEPSKTAKQCRYKMEKLRKRYRAERGKPRSKAANWSFFKLMEDLEKGPLPISSSQPMALVEYETPSNSNSKRRKSSHGDGVDDYGDVEFLVNKRSSRSKSSNHHVPNDTLARNLRFSDGGNRVVRGLRTPVVHKRKGFYQAEEDDGGDTGGEEEQVVAQLAAEIKGFAQKFVKMESKKIEMIKDIERYRLQMEDKRIEMILESQQMLIETVNKAFSSSHNAHKLSAS